MVDRSRIAPHMEVLASDGSFVGRVDGIEADTIKLTRQDSPDGQHHRVPLEWVERVDNHVHLSVGRDRVSGLGAGGGAAAGMAAGAASGPTRTSSHQEEGGPLPPVRNPAVDGARPRGNYYLPWIAGLLAALVLLFLLLRGCQEGVEDGRAARQALGSAAPTGAAAGQYAEGSIAHDVNAYLRGSEAAPRTFTFQRLNFDTNSATIRRDDVSDLDQIAQVLAAYPGARVAIVGYTDARGSGQANAQLGQQRAAAVVAALVERGVAANRLEARSGGEADPIAPNSRSEGRAENRRTELIVLSR